MNNKSAKFLVRAAVIGAIYFLCTILISPIAFGINQVRISEALNVLVYFTPAAIPGLSIGCLLANLSSPYGLIDILGGSLATLLSGLIAIKIKNKYFIGIPSIFINAIFVGMVLNVSGDIPIWAAMVSVGCGQAISIYAIGLPLLLSIEKNESIKSLFNIE